MVSRFLNFCFTSRVPKQNPDSEESTAIMEKPSARDADEAFQSVGLSIDSVEKKEDKCFQPEHNAHSDLHTPPNIILNHNFSEGLHMWHPNCCHAYVVSDETGPFALTTNRKECWQGLEQDITDRVSLHSTYTVSACVGISGALNRVTDDVLATLKLEHQDSSVSYLFIGRCSLSLGGWEKVGGEFSLSVMPKRVIFYLEGPSPGVDLLVRSVVVSCQSSSHFDSQRTGPYSDDNTNIILNSRFNDGLNNWSGRGCKIVLHDSMTHDKVPPLAGKFFGSTSERTENWNGIQQEITGRVQRKLAYEVTAFVKISGNNISSAEVRATLWTQAADYREQYIKTASVQATDTDWVQLKGKFLINGSPSKAAIYFEGPPPGTDILLSNLVVKRAAKVPPTPSPVIEKAAFGVNIITNSNLFHGTNSWFPLGNCTLTVENGSPRLLPPMARDSLGAHEPLSNRYILATDRTETWMGPAQIITDKLKLYLTYQVSAWVRIGNIKSSRPQKVNVALGVDSQWVNGGEVECGDDKWHEVGGSFRIEKKFEKVMAYVQGPEAGFNLMVAGLRIFPVDRQRRFRQLEMQTDKIRKRDVILNFTSPKPNSSFRHPAKVKITQTQNSFPFGSCISRSMIDNEDMAEFFTKNFNWAVFENELKWYWTEAQQGNLNYKDADELIEFCASRDIKLRGHCIFWEVESSVQLWVCGLDKDSLASAAKARLTGLMARYKGKFKHYDVNNEMLHGSFFRDRLGEDFGANMFITANRIDPSAVLFVNDYNVEDGCDSRSCPEKYICQVESLKEKGADVGGVGIQGHVAGPVGPVICSALDKLGVLGVPIWLTEVDVSSENEWVRADDLEVVMREAFAHPAVEGVVLWGFWEMFMSRENGWLVNAEGDLNEAGRRFVEVRREWLTNVEGCVDEEGRFGFRGFYGSYEVEVVGVLGGKKVVRTFVVDEGEEPLVVTISL